MDEVTQPSRHNVDIRKNSRDTGSRHGGGTICILSSVYIMSIPALFLVVIP